MAQHSIVKMAKQGDPKAIAYLITQTLKDYDITARANLQGCCLRVLLEAKEVPHQATMTKLVAQGMRKLNVATIQTIKLYGRRKGQAVPAWRQLLELTPFRSTTDPVEQDFDPAESPIFQLNDLDPEAVILFPVEPVEKVQLDDLDPEVMILFPVEPITASTSPAPSAEADELPEASFLSTAELAPPHVKAPPRFKLPKRLTGLLLIFLWLRLILNTLTLAYSLLSASSFSLYTGLDLANTNRPFASLLSGVVTIADLLFTPLDRLGLWISFIAILLSLFWLHRLHRSLSKLFEAYPISPWGAVVRFVLPLYNLWGIGSILFTLAKQLKVQANLKTPSQRIRRLTGWLYLFLFITAGLQGFYIWLINALPNAIPSLWFFVARDSAAWLLSLVWLRLVRVIWRAIRTIYQERVASLLPASPRTSRSRSSPLSLRAILLGGGASLLGLILFNCLLGVIAALVFVSNGLRPEAIIPTFYESESLLILVLLGSFLCIGLGGFLTAHVADVPAWAHAFSLGVILTLIGIALQRLPLLPMTELPFWFQTASIVLIIPAVLAGAGLRQWLKTL